LADPKRLGIEADQDTVAEAIQRIAENNKLTVPQLRQALADEGVEFRRFQDKVQEQIVIRRLINREVTNRIQVSKSEVDRYLARQAEAPDERRQVKLLHILITTPDGATAAQIQAAADKARRARARIAKGEDFRAVAQAVSDGPRAINGGDTGWLNVAELPEDFADLVNDMHDGEIVGPFRSRNGFHILKAEAFRNAEQPRHLVHQTHARHILIRTDEVTSDTDARQRLEQLRERALQGDDFAALARSSSDDQASAIKGGDLGWVSPGNMVPAFEEVMNRTPVGAISEPFKTRFGWHIVQVLAHRNHDETEEAKRLEARKAVRDRKAKEAKQQYLRRLRDQAYVELRLQDNQ
jgi:peptidyl-prolyl cis-trans isomerase SurA